MDKGHVVMDGTTREIFSQVELLKKYRLDVPQVTLLAHELKQKGYAIPNGILTVDELISALEACGMKTTQAEKVATSGTAVDNVATNETIADGTFYEKVDMAKSETPILKLEQVNISSKLPIGVAHKYNFPAIGFSFTSFHTLQAARRYTLRLPCTQSVAAPPSSANFPRAFPQSEPYLAPYQ